MAPDLTNHCYWFLCLAPLDASAPRFFGFAEFLAALALLVLAWTNADIRYRFRVATAPLPIYIITFSMVVALGVLTLLTDLWRAEQWPVIVGSLISPSQWQATLGALFLATFFLWTWFAFIRPPIFSRWNSFRFANLMYRIVLKGSPEELSIIAEEFWRSVPAIIKNSWENSEMHSDQKSYSEDELWKGKLRVRTCAYQILMMIGDKKFCRCVAQSPATALGIFTEVAKHKKFSLPLDVFAKNFTTEAIKNKDSFVYHEVGGYYTGLLGHYKPVTKAAYGNWRMAEGLHSLFDVDYRQQMNWDGEQWEAFQRIVLLCMTSYVEGGWVENHSFVLHRAVGEIGSSMMDAHTMNGAGSGDFYNTIPYSKITAALDFAEEASTILDLLDPKPISSWERKHEAQNRDVFRIVAEVMAKAVFAASTVRGPAMTSWDIQYGAVWHKLFGFREPSKARIILNDLMFRELLDDITSMKDYPNYKGTKILGMMLNVMGLEMYKAGNIDKQYRPFHRAVLAWTVKNFAALYDINPEVVESGLPEAISFDRAKLRLTKTYAKGLDTKPAQRHLKVKAPPPKRKPKGKSTSTKGDGGN